MASKLRVLLPDRWPVRWRLAAVSAGLTLIILLVFAITVGRLVGDRLTDDFNHQLTVSAGNIAVQATLNVNLLDGQVQVTSPDLAQLPLARDVAVRIVDRYGGVVDSTPNAPDLGRPRAGVSYAGQYNVATAPILSTINSVIPSYVQYARDRGSLDSTIDRLRLMLILGVLGGTALATLAGLAVAGRAMRPISSLTSTAREITTTRDPSQRVPQPQSKDEVAELAGTLDEMLHELDVARGETESMVQFQREFVADASHELGTPMTSILANLELIDEELKNIVPSPEKYEIEEMLESALRSSRRMRRLIGDLLLLARGDAGRLGGATPFDLATVVRETAAEIEPVLDNHELRLEVKEDTLPIKGNPDALHGMILNLLDNARRHTPAGTEIGVGLSRQDTETALLEVWDDGPGIPPDSRAQIFSRFVRGSGPADRDASQGTGLGLAIVAAVAHAHGGEVEVGESATGGAKFVITLPLDTETALNTGASDSPERNLN